MFTRHHLMPRLPSFSLSWHRPDCLSNGWKVCRHAKLRSLSHHRRATSLQSPSGACTMPTPLSYSLHFFAPHLITLSCLFIEPRHYLRQRLRRDSSCVTIFSPPFSLFRFSRSLPSTPFTVHQTGDSRHVIESATLPRQPHFHCSCLPSVIRRLVALTTPPVSFQRQIVRPRLYCSIASDAFRNTPPSHLALPRHTPLY